MSEPQKKERRRRWANLGFSFENAEALRAPQVGAEAFHTNRLMAQSPIARRIFVVNISAMLVLLSALLLLNSQERSLVEQRIASLSEEASTVTRTVRAFALQYQGDIPVFDQNRLRDVLFTISRPNGADIQIVDSSNQVMGQSRDISDIFGIVPSEQPLPEGAIGRAAYYISRFLSPVGVEEDRNAEQRALRSALSGTPQSIVFRDEAGRMRMSVAQPVVSRGEVIGATLVSTRAGQIDSAVQGDRGVLLVLFGLGIAVSMILSIILAGNIARPLRLLTAAAEKSGADASGERLMPEKIRIPDMSDRPDEIGYLAKAMRAMAEALVTRIQANESFAADVSHEIKNPLTSMRSAIETIRLVKTEEQRERLLEVVEDDVRRLDRLVTDISAASRLDSELVRTQMEPLELCFFIETVVGFSAAAAEDAKVETPFLRADKKIWVLGIESRLAQVLTNLITNAISFSQPGAVVTTILECSEAGKVLIKVEDQGPGIPDANLADVFERFYSERPGQAFGNHSGLGLAISKQIIEAHGGKIWAENIRPEGVGIDTSPLGARFCVELQQTERP